MGINASKDYSVIKPLPDGTLYAEHHLVNIKPGDDTTKRLAQLDAKVERALRKPQNVQHLFQDLKSPGRR